MATKKLPGLKFPGSFFVLNINVYNILNQELLKQVQHNDIYDNPFLFL